MDEALRNKLWSALHTVLFRTSDSHLFQTGNETDPLIARLWIHHFAWPVDSAPRYGIADLGERLRPWFFKAEWYEVYDLVEYLAADLNNEPKRSLVSFVNSLLEDEQSAYRLVDGRITEITSKEEISAIEAALSDASPLVAVREHLRSAVAKLSDRKAPDYRNSIKESISAVEAMCQAITCDATATLGQAIKRLGDSGISLHPTVVAAWSKLYGYTSDASGIRHALTDESNVSYADAKYMLVSCSAFVSYLIELSRQAHITLKSPGK